MIEFQCPSCQTNYRVADSHEGAKTTCRQCRQPLQVPFITLAAPEVVVTTPPSISGPAPQPGGAVAAHARPRWLMPMLAGGGALAAVLFLSCGLLAWSLVQSSGSVTTGLAADPSAAPTRPVAPTNALASSSVPLAAPDPDPVVRAGIVVDGDKPTSLPRSWDGVATGKPILAIEPEGHTATVTKVFLRDQGRQAITVSLDRTVRIWDVESGDLLNTLRLPAGPGERGQLEAAALSADENLLAVAGKSPDNGPAPVYLIAPQTGQLVQIIKTDLSLVRGLDISFDKQLLAVCGAGKKFYIYDLKTGKSVRSFEFQHQQHDPVYSVAFDPSGQRIAAGADDICRIWPVAGGEQLAGFGFANLRRFQDDPQTPSELRERWLMGGPVRALAWHPDGKSIAVGWDEGVVRVLHVATRKTLQNIHLSQSPARHMTQPVTGLRFSLDAKTIFYTGCDVRGKPSAGVLDAETGRRICEVPHETDVTAGAMSADGAVAISTGGPANEVFVWKTSDGTELMSFASRGRAKRDVMAWSEDGQTLAWRHERKAVRYPLDRSFRFSDLNGGERPTEDKVPWPVRTLPQPAKYRIFGGGHQISRLPKERQEGKTDKTISCGRPDEKLNRYGLSLGGDLAAIAGRQAIYIVDTEKMVVVRELQGHSAPVTMMVPSPDGRRLASASEDQTICIWNPEQAEALLTLFVTDTDWVAWTPQGYYAASSGGERLMGWLIGQGPESLGTFYPAGQFRKSLYRPDLVRRVFQTGNMAEAHAQATRENQRPAPANIEQAQPPLVAITDPPIPTGHRVTGTTVPVRAVARSVGGQPVTALRLLVDGRPYPQGLRTLAAPRAGDVEVSWSVALPPGKHVLAVQAETAASKGLSPPVEVMNTGAAAAAPNLYVVAVGINAYPGDLKLNYAAPDAEAISRAFKEQAGSKAFNTVEVKLLRDREGTRREIEQALDWLKSKMASQDVGVFFFSGHGDKDDRGNFYLIPVDVNLKDIPGSCTSGTYLKQTLGDMPGRVIAVLDACHSGAAIDARRQATAADNLIRDLVSDDYGIVVLSSSLGQEVSLESPAVGHGFYTQALVEGLSGLADRNRNGIVDLNELDRYAARRVEELSRGVQHPVANRPPSIRAFPIAKSTTMPPPRVPPKPDDLALPPLVEKGELQGLWQVLTYQYDGEARDTKDYYWSIHRDTIRYEGKGTGGRSDKFKLDTARKHFDIPRNEFPAMRQYHMQGIYALEGDSLKVCYEVTGERRPTEFASPKDSRIAYYVLKRLSTNPEASVEYLRRGGVQPEKGPLLAGRPDEVIQSLRYLPDGRFLASLGADGVQLWDVAAAKPERWLIKANDITSVDFSFDSNVALVCRAGSATVLDVATGKELGTFKVDGMVGGGLSPDGKTVAAASPDQVRLIDVVSGKILDLPRLQGAGVRGGAFTGDSKTIAIVQGSLVLLYDVASGKEQSRWDTKQPLQAPLTMTQDAKILAISDGNRTVKLHDIATGRELRAFPDHELPVTGLTFSTDGQRLITVAAQGISKYVRIYDVADGKAMLVPGYLADGALAPDRKRIACAKAADIQLYDINTDPQGFLPGPVPVVQDPGGTVIGELKGEHSAPIKILELSPDGKILASGAEDGVVLWDLPGRKLLRRLTKTPKVRSLSFSADGKLVLVGAGQPGALTNSATLFDVETGKELSNRDIRGACRTALTPDGKRLCFVGVKCAGVIDLATGTQHDLPVIKNETYITIAVSPDGKSLAAGNWVSNPMLALWDLESKQRKDLEVQKSMITEVRFTPDGTSLVATHRDRAATLYDAKTGALTQTLKTEGWPLMCLAVSPDGKRVAIGSSSGPARVGGISDAGGHIRVWDVAAGKQLGAITTGGLHALAFTPDGKHLIAPLKDSINIWDLKLSDKMR